jgi:hypothetical protein
MQVRAGWHFELVYFTDYISGTTTIVTTYHTEKKKGPEGYSRVIKTKEDRSSAVESKIINTTLTLNRGSFNLYICAAEKAKTYKKLKHVLHT